MYVYDANPDAEVAVVCAGFFHWLVWTLAYAVREMELPKRRQVIEIKW